MVCSAHSDKKYLCGVVIASSLLDVVAVGFQDGIILNIILPKVYRQFLWLTHPVGPIVLELRLYSYQLHCPDHAK